LPQIITPANVFSGIVSTERTALLVSTPFCAAGTPTQVHCRRHEAAQLAVLEDVK
jgi:hypothetical protein